MVIIAVAETAATTRWNSKDTTMSSSEHMLCLDKMMENYYNLEIISSGRYILNNGPMSSAIP